MLKIDAEEKIAVARGLRQRPSLQRGHAAAGVDGCDAVRGLGGIAERYHHCGTAYGAGECMALLFVGRSACFVLMSYRCIGRGFLGAACVRVLAR
jgi:hypothetical protein